MYLDDHIVEKADVHAALTAAFPGLGNDPIGLWGVVNSRWDLEIGKALPAAPPPLTRPKPDGLLTRGADGKTYWSPAPIQTIGGGEPLVVGNDWITDFLDFYDLAPADDGSSNGTCKFNSGPDTVDNVVKVLGEQAELAGYKSNPGGASGIAKSILDSRLKAQQQGADVAKRAAGGAPSAASGPPPNEGGQFVVGVGGQLSGHWELTPLPTKKADPPSDEVIQFQFGVNYVNHPKDEKGNEFQGQLIVGYNARTHDFQVLAGAQYVRVLAVWNTIQLQFFANVDAGIAKKLSDKSPVHGVLQGQAGAQVVWNPVGGLQFGIALGGGGTISQGPPTADASAQATAAYAFDLSPAPPKRDPRPTEVDINELLAMRMVALLDAMEKIRSLGQIDKIPTNNNRIAAAIMTVKLEFQDKNKSDAFNAFIATLSAADQDAIKRYVDRHTN